MGIDRAEIRKRNYLPNDVFPNDNLIIDQAFASFVIDSGDYLLAMEKALKLIDYEKFIQEEQPKLREEGGCWHVNEVRGRDPDQGQAGQHWPAPNRYDEQDNDPSGNENVGRCFRKK